MCFSRHHIVWNPALRPGLKSGVLCTTAVMMRHLGGGCTSNCIKVCVKLPLAIEAVVFFLAVAAASAVITPSNAPPMRLLSRRPARYRLVHLEDGAEMTWKREGQEVDREAVLASLAGEDVDLQEVSQF